MTNTCFSVGSIILGALGPYKSSHLLYMCGTSRPGRRGSKHFWDGMILAMRGDRQIIDASRSALYI